MARFCFLGFVVSSLGTAHYAYLFRTLQVKQKAIITVTGLSLSSLVGITLAYLGFSYWALAIQGVLFSTCNTILFWHFSHWRPTLPVSFKPLREMFGFSSKLLATAICTNINTNILSVVLGRFYSVVHVGYYNQANKWTSMGSNLIQSTILEVAQPVLRGVADDRGRQKRVFRKMLRFTSFLAFPALFGLAFVSRELILVAVGEKWLESVPLMQVLCLCAFTAPVGQLCLNLVVAKGRSDLVLWNTVGFGLMQLAAVCLTHSYGLMAMVCALAPPTWLGCSCGCASCGGDGPPPARSRARHGPLCHAGRRLHHLGPPGHASHRKHLPAVRRKNHRDRRGLHRAGMVQRLGHTAGMPGLPPRPRQEAAQWRQTVSPGRRERITAGPPAPSAIGKTRASHPPASLPKPNQQSLLRHATGMPQQRAARDRQLRGLSPTPVPEAPHRRAEPASAPCGKHSSTLRQVLKYSPQSTIPHSARRFPSARHRHPVSRPAACR